MKGKEEHWCNLEINPNNLLKSEYENKQNENLSLQSDNLTSLLK